MMERKGSKIRVKISIFLLITVFTISAGSSRTQWQNSITGAYQDPGCPARARLGVNDFSYDAVGLFKGNEPAGLRDKHPPSNTPRLIENLCRGRETAWEKLMLCLS